MQEEHVREVRQGELLRQVVGVLRGQDVRLETENRVKRKPVVF